MQGESEKDMIKTYAIIYQNQISGKVGMDTFSGNSDGAVRKDFHDCYRHGNYNILSVTEIPEIQKQEAG